MKSRRASLLKRAALVVLTLLLAIQLIPVERTNPPAKLQISAPADVHAILERSCYDCHSNHTRWPWYSYVAPASWFVVRHVGDAREDLNLTEWPLMDTEAQQFYLGEMKKKIKNREMPLRSYLLIHWDAQLSEHEREMLLTWIDEEVALLSATVWP